MKCLVYLPCLQQETDQGNIDLIPILDVPGSETFLPKLLLDPFDDLYGLSIRSESFVVPGQRFERLTFSILELPHQLGIPRSFGNAFSGSIMLERILWFTAFSRQFTKCIERLRLD